MEFPAIREILNEHYLCLPVVSPPLIFPIGMCCSLCCSITSAIVVIVFFSFFVINSFLSALSHIISVFSIFRQKFLKDFFIFNYYLYICTKINLNAMKKEHETYKKGYITDSANEKLFDVLNSFNFEKVYEVMCHLNWTWATTNDDVPEVYDIRDNAYKLLVECYHTFWGKNNCKPITISTGGLCASYEYFDDCDIDNNQHNFTLEFVVEQVSNI